MSRVGQAGGDADGDGGGDAGGDAGGGVPTNWLRLGAPDSGQQGADWAATI